MLKFCLLLDLPKPHSSPNFTVHCTWVSAIRTEEHEIAELFSVRVQHTLPPAVQLRQGMRYPPVLYRCSPCLGVHKLTNSQALTHTQLHMYMNSLGCISSPRARWSTERSVIRSCSTSLLPSTAAEWRHSEDMQDVERTLMNILRFDWHAFLSDTAVGITSTFFRQIVYIIFKIYWIQFNKVYIVLQLSC